MANQPATLKVKKNQTREELGPANTLWRDASRRLIRHKLAMFGAFVLITVTIMALFGPYIAPYDPNGMDFAVRFAGPCRQ